MFDFKFLVFFCTQKIKILSAQEFIRVRFQLFSFFMLDLIRGR